MVEPARISESQLRIFISCARDDARVVERIRKHLHSLGVRLLGDQLNMPGKPFAQEIKDLIAHAQVFMPVLTKRSRRHPWVHLSSDRPEAGLSRGDGDV